MRGTCQQSSSASALLRSSLSISDFPSVVSSAVSFVVFFASFGLFFSLCSVYPIPFVISSKLSLFEFGVVDLFFILLLVLQMSPDLKRAALLAPCRRCPRPSLGVILGHGREVRLPSVCPLAPV
jgi:hypothetical protein